MAKRRTVPSKWIRTESDKQAILEGCYFDQSAVDYVLDFFRAFLKQSKGRWAGEPFTLLPWQIDLISMLYGWKNANGFRRFRFCYVEIPKKNGKALDIETPIPTPNGWKRMGELCVGDIVFDECGKPCTVTHATDVMTDHICYRLTFSDHTSITADADHEWLTKSRRPENTTSIRTTSEIYQDVRIESRGSEGANHSIQVGGGLLLPDSNLPINPYVLGAWLGDGYSDSARIVYSINDSEILQHIESCGITTHSKAYKQTCPTARLINDGKPIQSILRKQGLLNNKHIPGEYLRASYNQRLSLLQGLMDTDGYCSEAGQCEFTTIKPVLRDQVIELIRSLGLKPVCKTARATINGRDCGEKYRLIFNAFSDVPVFRLSRKLKRQRSRPTGNPRSCTKQIISVVPVDSVPVRCIQVDSPSHLYLAGEGFIPTHNSTLVAGLSLYHLIADGERGAEVYCAAADRQQARIVFSEAENMVKQSESLSEVLEILRSEKTILFPGTLSRMVALSADAETKEGFNASFTVIDELFRQKTRSLFQTLRYAGRSREQPLMFCITTAGFDRQSLCWEQHEYSKSILDGTVIDTTYLPVIYAADPGDDLDDPKIWAKANPSMGQTIKVDDFANEWKQAKQSSISCNSFKQYSFNLWTSSNFRFVPIEKWNNCSQPIDEEMLRPHTSFGGCDLSATQDSSALVLLFDDGSIIARCWLPEARVVTNPKYELWRDQGYLTVTPGEVIDHEYILQEIVKLSKQFNIDTIYLDPHNATHLCQLIDQQTSINLKFHRQNLLNMNAPTKELERLILTRQLKHGGNPVLAAQAENAVAHIDRQGNCMIVKENREAKIDLMVALCMAVQCRLSES